MNGLDLERLRIHGGRNTGSGRRQRLPRHRRGELFLKGPIPLTWIQSAASLPGRALAVGLEIWFWAGLKKSGDVRIALSRLRVAPGMPRSTAARALKELERAGLVSVRRGPGRKPRVRLEVPSGGEADFGSG